jgi:DNA primase
LLFQSGFDNVVSSSGTALTVDQLRVLKRYSDNLMTAFDMDFAGDSATKRGIDLAQSMGFNIKIITMPEGLDPADTVLKDSSLFGRLIEKSKNIYEFYFDTTFSKFNYKDPKDKKIIANILLPLLKRIPNKIEQSFWVQKLSQMLEVRENDVWEELEKVNISRDEYLYEPEEIVVAPEHSKKSRKDLLEERLLALTLKFPGLVENLSSHGKDLLDTIRKNAFSNQDYLNYLYLLAERDDLSEKDAFYEAEFCVREIMVLNIKEKLESISNDIRKAENENDFKRMEQLIQEFNYLSKKIQLS